MKTISISKILRSSIFAAVFAASFAFAGCSADVISGMEEETSGPTTYSTSQPQDPHPGNDDCSVSDC